MKGSIINLTITVTFFKEQNEAKVPSIYQGLNRINQDLYFNPLFISSHRVKRLVHKHIHIALLKTLHIDNR